MPDLRFWGIEFVEGAEVTQEQEPGFLFQKALEVPLAHGPFWNSRSLCMELLPACRVASVLVLRSLQYVCQPLKQA